MLKQELNYPFFYINLFFKAFVSELISDEAQKTENELIGDLRDRILFLQKVVNNKEKDDGKSFMKKREDIIICKSIIEKPTEQVMTIFKDLLATKSALGIINKKYIRLKSEQKELIALNYVNKVVYNY